MPPRICLPLLLALAGCEQQPAGPQLPALALDTAGLTVSGVSSGGYMAHQFHIAHAASVAGAAVIAAGPYYCADGGYPFNINAASNVCMNLDDWMPFTGPPPAAASLLAIRTEAGLDRIDDPARLREDRVYLFSGTEDETVPQSVTDSLYRVYRELVDNDRIVYVADVAAGHAMITDDPAHAACDATAAPFLNDCGRDLAGELLQHLYGDLAAPVAARPDGLQAFAQAPFADDDPDDIGLATRGYLYLPASCHDGARCRLHVAFHGCGQNAGTVDRAYVEGAGYNEWAEANGIVVLYPQTTGDRTLGLPWPNPHACWDWWGYTGADYHVRDGAQIRAVRRMIERLAGT